MIKHTFTSRNYAGVNKCARVWEHIIRQTYKNFYFRTLWIQNNFVSKYNRVNESALNSILSNYNYTISISANHVKSMNLSLLFPTLKTTCTVQTWKYSTSLHTLHTPPSRWTQVLCECCHWYVSIWQLFQMKMIYFQPPHTCLVPLCQGIFCDYFLCWRSEVLELYGVQLHLRFLLLQKTHLLKNFLLLEHITITLQETWVHYVLRPLHSQLYVLIVRGSANNLKIWIIWNHH